jgi:chaperonin GroES
MKYLSKGGCRMAFRRMLAEADPVTAARAAVKMAEATVSRATLPAATRAQSQAVLDLGVEALATRIRNARSTASEISDVEALSAAQDVESQTSPTSSGDATRSASQNYSPPLPAVPVEDGIVVRINEVSTEKASGLTLPRTTADKQRAGTVVAVGPGRWDEDGEKRMPLDVTKGDVIIYSKYGGTEIEYSGEEYLIISSRDVLAVVSTPAPEDVDGRRPRH